MDFNMQSAHAALLGAAYGTPLLLCSIAARSQLFKDAFPVLAQMHEQQAGLQKRILAGAQRACSRCREVLALHLVPLPCKAQHQP